MKYLAHRGFWLDPKEKNGEIAFRRAFANGFGVETDVRDLDGGLVISHDMPRAGAMTLACFLDIYLEYPARPLLALNVKADGLCSALAAELRARSIENYFVFDMSVPDLLAYRSAGLRYYVRRSEFEEASPLDADASGVWMDAFEQGFSSVEAIGMAGAAVNGMIALVSPELHRREPGEAWAAWKRVRNLYADRLILCTDHPSDAQAFFERGPVV